MTQYPSFETISLTQAVYGDYDIPIGTSIKNLDVGNPTTGIATVKTQGGVGIATVGIGSMKILKRDGNTIIHDQWPYLDIRSVEEQGVTDSSGNEIPRNTNKIYLPDYVGITSILKVDNSDSDPITNKKFLVTGKYLEGNVRIVNVAYNSRLTLAKSHTANDEILGLTSTIPISIGANKVVTEVIIVTDEHKIVHEIKQFQGNYKLIQDKCLNGTERIIKYLQQSQQQYNK